MEEQLAAALTAIIQTATDAKNFVLSELPDVISQLLLWKATYNFMWFAILIVLAVVLYKYYVKLDIWITSKLPEDSDSEASKRIVSLQTKGYTSRTSSEDRELARLIRGSCPGSRYRGCQYILLGAMAIPILLILTFGLTWLQILIAPKLYLIEYAAALVK